MGPQILMFQALPQKERTGKDRPTYVCAIINLTILLLMAI